MVVCPSERSARDEDYQNWMEEILDDLAELKFPALQVVTFLGPGKIDHHTYKLSDSFDSED